MELIFGLILFFILELITNFSKNIDGFNIDENFLFNVFRRFSQALYEQVEERFNETLVLNLLHGNYLQKLIDHFFDRTRFLVALISKNQLEQRKNLLQIKLIFDLV